jgi:hypothetical protein
MKYFKHDLTAIDDDKMFELIDTHGMQGYGIWWALLEKLYSAEDNGFQIEATETWFKRISKQFNLTDWRTLIRILDTIAGLGLINAQLWDEHIIHAPGIAKRADQYIRAKQAAAERKQKQREREKEAMSRVTHAVQAPSHKPVTTNTDPDPDPDLYTNTDQESGTDAPPARTQPRDPSNRGTKRGRESAQQVYESLMDRSGFESFWVWYKKQICAIAGSSEGDKSKAGLAWRDLEQDNFRGIGRDGFRQACKTYKDRAIAAKGIGIPHAERFLSGGELREPRWLVLHLEHNVDGDPNFLDGVCDEDDLQDLSKAIGSELSRLGWRGVIPDDWRNQSGIPAQVVSDLDARQANAYLQYLRGQDARVEK